MKAKIKRILFAGMCLWHSAAGAETTLCLGTVEVNSRPHALYRVYLEEYPAGQPPQVPVILELGKAVALNPDSAYKIRVDAFTKADMAEVIRMFQILAGVRNGE